jgi:hypothetical protein
MGGEFVQDAFGKRLLARVPVTVIWGWLTIWLKRRSKATLHKV